MEREPGTDSTGAAGLQDRVNYHWGRVFLAAGLATILNLALESGGESEDDVATAIREATQNTIDRTGDEIVRQQIAVPPTPIIRPGFSVPRNKTGNDQRIPLFAATGFDAWASVTEQAKELGHARGRIFPYNSRSVGTAFRRACVEVSVKDLHFHDLRHEGTSCLFEAGFAIEQVSLVTGHKDWKMLRRYTHV